MQDAERDPIVEDDAIMAELREIRAQMVAKVGNDPGAILEYVDRKWWPVVKDRLIRLPKREGPSTSGERSDS